MEIKIIVTENQNEALNSYAKKMGTTVEDYIKLKIFGNDDIKKIIEITLKKIEKLKAGQKFNISQLFGVDWNQYNRGIKLSLGKAMLRESEKDNSIFEALKDSDGNNRKDSANTQWYIKK